jgi:hypothetical protein
MDRSIGAVPFGAPDFRLHPASLRRESRRRFVVRTVFFIFLLSLIEGPLRKWFLPGLAGPLTVLRDPFVIALYGYCIACGLIFKRSLAALWLGFAFVTSLLGLVQYAASGLPVQGWMLGVRTYWLYMPLAFVIAHNFRRGDIERFFILNLWIAIPYALLVAAQYNSPRFAFINLGVGGDETGAVGLSDGILRPFGLFTYTSPNVDYTAAMIAMLLALYLCSKQIHMLFRGIFLLMTGSATASMAVLTGSRLIYFLAAATICITALGMLASRPGPRTIKRILGIACFVLLAGLLFTQLYPDMLTAMEERFYRAVRSEGSIWNRVFNTVFAFLKPLATAPVFGYGIGSGAPGVANYLGLPALIHGEADTRRNINELGLVFGSAFLLLRAGTLLWLFYTAFRLARQNVLPVLPLLGYIAPILSIGQITHSPLNAFYPWIFVGFILVYATETRQRQALY